MYLELLIQVIVFVVAISVLAYSWFYEGEVLRSSGSKTVGVPGWIKVLVKAGWISSLIAAIFSGISIIILISGI